jgi:hypothetical protein
MSQLRSSLRLLLPEEVGVEAAVAMVACLLH